MALASTAISNAIWIVPFFALAAGVIYLNLVWKTKHRRQQREAEDDFVQHHSLGDI